MSGPKFNEVAAADLTACVVYVGDDDEHMLVLEAGENADNEPGGPTCFVSARSLVSFERTEEHLAVSRRKPFTVIVDGMGAIRDAGDLLDERIRREVEVLAALPESDTARRVHKRQLREDRAQREWLAGQAVRCGVRLRPS